MDQVKDSLQRTQTQTAEEICRTILDEVQEFTGKPPRHNDVTVLALARQAAAKALAAASSSS